ncbi:DUF885 domain-containing protein [Nocardia callitridis]|uniref:DUF885 domain-containing protein n=1 Tax=Nocardia callitridis TaxID=648753 RepID=A0ABP9K9A1_9NOCA
MAQTGDTSDNGHDLATYSARVLHLLWSYAPDAAIEVGRLPPVLWEDPRRGNRDALRERAAELADAVSEIRGGSDDFVAAARYHLECAASTMAHSDIGELNHMTGPVSRLSWASRSWPRAEDPRFARYVERLRAFPEYASRLIGEIEQAGTRGSTPVLRAFVEQVDTLVAERETGPDPLLFDLEAARAEDDSVVTPPQPVLDDVYVALADLRMVAVAAQRDADETSPLADSAAGASRYRDAILRGTSVSITPERVEALGRNTLRATDAEFAALAERATAHDSLVSAAEILSRFRRAHAMLDAKSRVLVEHWPHTPCEVIAMPDTNAATGPAAFYGPSSHRNNRPGSLYVNLTVPSVTRPWEVLPLAMHEGVPGHHLQLALLDENDELPDLLRLLPVNSFTEGWAVYSETLASTIGAVADTDDLDRLGLLAHQRWRAARLVVDVGLHVHGWSVERAVEFMVEQTRLDAAQVRKEVIRYLAWPGQALGYALGAQVISEWVREQLDAGKSLAAAHTALLARGSLPLRALATDRETG